MIMWWSVQTLWVEGLFPCHDSGKIYSTDKMKQNGKAKRKDAIQVKKHQKQGWRGWCAKRRMKEHMVGEKENRQWCSKVSREVGRRGDNGKSQRRQKRASGSKEMWSHARWLGTRWEGVDCRSKRVQEKHLITNTIDIPYINKKKQIWMY